MQPDWFNDYIARKPSDHVIRVAGADVHYLHWPNPGKPGLVLVHGHAAHAHWWDFIAPALADFDVIAPDLSGSGDSDHRSVYRAGLFADEILACSKAAGLRNPVIVGHSFGGSMTRIAAWQHPEEVRAIILIDSALPEHRGSRQPPPMPRQRTRYYPSLAEAKRRFRLRPPQPCENHYLLSYIAEHSVRQHEEGYAFKLDSSVFARMPADETFPAAAEMVRSLTMPVGFIYGENSRFFDEQATSHLETIIEPGMLIGIPDAYHHVFLDQPEAFTEALRQLLSSIDQG